MRRELVEPDNKKISVLRQCQLLGINRTGLYYRGKPESFEDGELMRLNGRAIYRHTVLRLSANDGLFAEFGISGQSQAREALDAKTRTRSDLPKA